SHIPAERTPANSGCHLAVRAGTIAAMSTLTTSTVVREATAADTEECGRIFYDAFESIAAPHHCPVEPGSREFTRFKAAQLIAGDGIAALVAERDGKMIGSAFVDERGPIAGIGPVTVDPAAQDDGAGRALMEAALRRARSAPGVRLVQTAYHYRSLALYAKLGFAVREPLAVLQGTPPALTIPGLRVRPAGEPDVAACARLCTRVHGHDRTGEVRAAIADGT